MNERSTFALSTTASAVVNGKENRYSVIASFTPIPGGWKGMLWVRRDGEEPCLGSPTTVLRPEAWSAEKATTWVQTQAMSIIRGATSFTFADLSWSAAP